MRFRLVKQTLKQPCLVEAVFFITIFSLFFLQCYIFTWAITLSASVIPIVNPTAEKINLWAVLLPALIKILLDGQGFSCHHCFQASVTVFLTVFVLLSLTAVLVSYNTFSGLMPSFFVFKEMISRKNKGPFQEIKPEIANASHRL